MENKVEILMSIGGPIVVKGNIELVDVDGTVTEHKKCYLCRCGASRNKPFCDGMHKKINFEG